MFAFEKRTGKILWSHDFIKEFNSPELLIRPVTIDVTTAAPDAKSSTLKYSRITVVGPCESWPTPCKRF